MQPQHNPASSDGRFPPMHNANHTNSDLPGPPGTDNRYATIESTNQNQFSSGNAYSNANRQPPRFSLIPPPLTNQSPEPPAALSMPMRMPTSNSYTSLSDYRYPYGNSDQNAASFQPQNYSTAVRSAPPVNDFRTIPPPPMSSAPRSSSYYSDKEESRPPFTAAPSPYQFALTRNDAERVRYDPPSVANSSRSPMLDSPSRTWSAEYTQGNSVPSSPNSIRKANSRIDPAQMPRPPRPNIDVTYHTKSSSGARKNPPCVNSLFTAVDNGNCSPRFMRASMVAPPTSKLFQKQLQIPMAVIATPFAQTENEEIPVPLVRDVGRSPPRCTRCQAYVNSAVQWCDNGRAWKCNLCGMSNAVEPWYYCALDGDGRRLDLARRPELSHGSVEFLVSAADYSVRAPQEPVFVFAIDASDKALANGLTMAAIRAVRRAVDRLRELQACYDSESPYTVEAEAAILAGLDGGVAPTTDPSGASFIGGLLSTIGLGTTRSTGDSTNLSTGKSDLCASTEKSAIRVGVVTFDRGLHCYQVRLDSTEPLRLLVCNDPDDPFCSAPPDSWLHSVGTSAGAQSLELLLDKLPETIAAMQYLDPNGYVKHPVSSSTASDRRMVAPNCCTAVVKALRDGLTGLGGRLHLLTSNHATCGVGAIPADCRVEQRGIYSGLSHGVDEMPFYTTAAQVLRSSKASKEEKVLCEVYVDLARSCVDANVSVSTIVGTGDLLTAAMSTMESSGMAALQPMQPAGVDAVLLSELTEVTGGRYYNISGNLNDEEQAQRMEQQLLRCIDNNILAGASVYPALIDSDEQAEPSSSATAATTVEYGGGCACEAVVKVRTSLGVCVDEVISGPFGHSESHRRNEVYWGAVDVNSSLCIMLKHDGGSSLADGVASLVDAVSSGDSKPSAIVSSYKAKQKSSVLQDEEPVFLQLAVLYTNLRRQRVVRVHNLRMQASEKPATVFRNCDVEVVAAVLAKLALSRALWHPLCLDKVDTGPRELVYHSVMQILLSYRVHCAGNSPRGQLILPESLKTLPLYSLGLLKHPALLENGVHAPTTGIGGLSNGVTSTASSTVNCAQYSPPQSKLTPQEIDARLWVRAHERAFEIRKLLAAPLKEVVNALYPRVYSLLSLFTDDSIDEFETSRLASGSVHSGVAVSGIGSTLTIDTSSNDNDGTDPTQQPLPSPVKNAIKTLCSLTPSSELFESDQVYLLDDRTQLWLYVGRAVEHGVVADMLDLGDGSSYYAHSFHRPLQARFNSDTRLGRRLKRFVVHIQSQCAYVPELHVIWADMGSNPLLRRFAVRLVEDAVNGAASYVDYLCNMHMKIVTQLTMNAANGK